MYNALVDSTLDVTPWLIDEKSWSQIEQNTKGDKKFTDHWDISKSLEQAFRQSKKDLNGPVTANQQKKVVATLIKYLQIKQGELTKLQSNNQYVSPDLRKLSDKIQNYQEWFQGMGFNFFDIFINYMLGLDYDSKANFKYPLSISLHVENLKKHEYKENKGFSLWIQEAVKRHATLVSAFIMAHNAYTTPPTLKASESELSSVGRIQAYMPNIPTPKIMNTKEEQKNLERVLTALKGVIEDLQKTIDKKDENPTIIRNLEYIMQVYQKYLQSLSSKTNSATLRKLGINLLKLLGAGVVTTGVVLGSLALAGKAPWQNKKDDTAVVGAGGSVRSGGNLVVTAA